MTRAVFVTATALVSGRRYIVVLLRHTSMELVDRLVLIHKLTTRTMSKLGYI